MGLALSLRRLDLVEELYLSSQAPSQGSSKSAGTEHDESLLRYVLSEIVSGASGNEAWSVEFRQRVSYLIQKVVEIEADSV